MVLSEKEAQLLLRDDEDLVLAVYDYWLAKRLRLGRSLIPTVRNISKDGTSSSGNPYLAFRKRMEKMQTRKVLWTCIINFYIVHIVHHLI